MNVDIINKVKALLSKTTNSGCTEAEAQIAIAKANELITKYNISIDEIDNKAEEEVWGQGKVIEAGKWTLDINVFNGVVTQYFFVKSIKFGNGERGIGRGFTLYFYGKRENVVTAKYIFDALMFASNNLWNKYRQSTKCEAKFRQIFIVKLAEGFCEKLRLERSNLINKMDTERQTSGSTAISIRNVEIQLVEKYRKTYPNVKTATTNLSPISYNDRVAQAGYNAGKNLNINRPISTTNKKSIN